MPKIIVQTHAKVSSYFFLCMSVLACEYPLQTYYLNRLFLRRGKRKSVMSKATLQNNVIVGTLRKILKCLYYMFDLTVNSCYNDCTINNNLV